MSRYEDRWLFRITSFVAGALFLASFAPQMAQAQPSSTVVTGIVVSAGQALPGVLVVHEGVVVETTDESGRFSISLQDRSLVRLEFRAEGFLSRSLVAGPGEEPIVVTLAPLPQFEDVIIVTARRELAMIQREVSVEKIGRAELSTSPSLSAAGAIERVAGVSTLSDNGEPDEISIRGMEPRLTSTMIDGERIPGTDGDDRTAALFFFPVGLLETIEVQTTFTPEMDADAIGGSVNLLTRKAPTGGVTQVRLAAGHEDQSGGDRAEGGVVWGRRGFSDRLGAMLALDGDGGDQGVDRVHRGFDEQDLVRFELRDLEIDRTRLGGLLRLDHAPSSRSDLSFKIFATEFSETEVRRRALFDAEEREASRDLRVNESERTIVSLDVSGLHVLDHPIRIGYRVGYAHAREDVPERLDLQFLLEDVELETNDGVLDPIEENLEEFVLDEFAVETHRAEDDNIHLGLDLAIPMYLRGRSVDLRTGLKLRSKDKMQRTMLTTFSADDDVFLTDLLDRRFESEVIAGLRPLGPVPVRSEPGELVDRFGLEGERELVAEASNYDASEDSIAGYGLLETELGSRTMILAGLRYELTETAYEGRAVRFVEEDGEEVVVLERTRGRSDYEALMPAVLAAFEVSNELKLKGGITRTFARPDYIQLVPFTQIDRDDEEVERGNPDLRLTKAWNFDVSLGWTPSERSDVTIAPYYKLLHDFIFDARDEVEIGGEIFRLIEPRNGDDARVYGLDLTFHHEPRPRMRWLEGLFFDVNLSWARSRAAVPSRSSENLPLPGQAEWTGDLVLGLAGRHVDFRLIGSYVDDQLLEVGESSSEDLYARDRHSLDLWIGVPIRRSIEIFVRGQNLTDERVELYEGVRSRPVELELSGRRISVGLRYSG